MDDDLICIIKKCIKCHKVLTLNMFPNHKPAKDGKRNICKECEKIYKKKHREENAEYISNFKKEWCLKNKERLKIKKKTYYEENKEEINAKNKANYEKNKEQRSIQGKEYREKNKEIVRLRKQKYHNENKELLNQKNKEYGESPVKYVSSTFILLSQYEEIRQDPNNSELGQVKCTYCGKWYNPNVRSVNKRLNAIKGTGKGEGRLYDSDNCKKSCPTYGRISKPKDFKPMTSREVDPLVRQMAMERDEYRCQMCFRESDEIALHAHHILSYNKNVIMANDIDNVIILCKDCHKEIHMREGCKYNQFKCK